MIEPMPRGCDSLEWDRFWQSKRGSEWQSRSRSVMPEIARLFRSAGKVFELGFGTLEFARLIGKHRWTGSDVSEVAVERAAAEGYTAHLGISVPVGIGSSDAACAFQSLSYMSEPVRAQVLWFMARAGIVAITDMKGGERPFRSIDQFEDYLLRFFPTMITREVRVGRKTLFVAEARR